MHWHIVLLLIGLALIKGSACGCGSNNGPRPRIAIIGAGIGGASTAHFLTELFNGNLDIDIYESNKVGVRLATIQVGHHVYEAGGSLIHPGNKYMTDFVRLLAMNSSFPRLLTISSAEFLHDLGFSRNVINELVQATLVQNYGQTTGVQSFVGCVSAVGAAATAGGGLWSVHGGNQKVPEQLIERNDRVRTISAQVTKITYIVNEKYEYGVSYERIPGGSYVQHYDIVIIATPFIQGRLDQIRFVGFPTDFKPPLSENYQTTRHTFIKGLIKFSYRDLEAILSSDPDRTVFNSIIKLSPVNKPTGICKVWRISSKNPLTLKQIYSMFWVVWEVRSVEWKAYPKYSPTVRLDKFKLYDLLYHVNAIEWAASAMEMSAIAGRNVALLAHKNFISHCLIPQSRNSEVKFVHKYPCEVSTQFCEQLFRAESEVKRKT